MGVSSFNSAASTAEGWKNVAQTGYELQQGTAQNAAVARFQQQAMAEQAQIKLTTDIAEGRAKMVKGAGEAFKGLC